MGAQNCLKGSFNEYLQTTFIFEKRPIQGQIQDFLKIVSNKKNGMGDQFHLTFLSVPDANEIVRSQRDFM